MGNFTSIPIEPQGNKTLPEWVYHIANVVAMNQQEFENLLGGRLSSMNIRELTADKIVTGILLASLVTIQADLNSGAFIRIDGNGMVINDGTNDVFVADINGNVTATSITLRSVASGERIEIDSTGLHSYDVNGIERITIGTTPAEGAKAIIGRDAFGVASSVYTYDTANVDGATRTGQYVTGPDAQYLLLDDAGGIRLQETFSSRGFRALPSTRTQINNGSGWLNVATTNELPSGFTGSFSTGTQTVNVLNGVITSVV